MNRKKLSVLVICTGNIFRSMSAELMLNTIHGKTRLVAQSAGTIAKKQAAFPQTITNLESAGVSAEQVAANKQRRVTKQILNSADVIVCMAKHHQTHIKEKFGVDSWCTMNLQLANQQISWMTRNTLQIVDQHKKLSTLMYKKLLGT